MSFENKPTKCVIAKEVEWNSPDRISLDLGDGEGFKIYELLKGAEDYLHKELGLKTATSKEVYKKSEPIWKELKDVLLDKCLDKPRDIDIFKLNKETLAYIVNDDGYVIDIDDLKTDTMLEEFKDSHEKFNVNLNTKAVASGIFQDCKGGLSKYVRYAPDVDITKEDYVPVVIMELNFLKSTYKAYSGILIYKNFTFIPALSADIEDTKFTDFVKRFDMSELLKYSQDRGEELYESYLRFKENPVEISAREMTALFKKVGYKIEFDGDETKIKPIEQLNDEESNLRVQEFYNTFKQVTGESAFEIVQLTDFKKIFRYNKMSILDMLAIMSKEYLTYGATKITADVLGDIVYKLYGSNAADKSQVTAIEQELK